MQFRITTQHADYEKLFGGPSIVVECSLGEDARVIEAENPALIGEKIELSADSPPCDQLAAMYSAEAWKISD